MAIVAEARVAAVAVATTDGGDQEEGECGGRGIERRASAAAESRGGRVDTGEG